MIKIAIAQHSPAFLDLEACIKKAGGLIEQSANQNARLIIFGESWFSGYPAWLDYCPEAALWDHEPAKQVYARMFENSMSIGGTAFKQLQEMARTHQVYLVFGLNEKVTSGRGNGTIYNALVILGPDGALLNHHRKLMPTYTEKLVYGMGDGYGLRSIEIDGHRMGGLICWEHWMPHARQSMHDDGEILHVAVWPTVHEIHQIASRSYAFEGRCFVVSVGQILKVSDIPVEVRNSESREQTGSSLVLRGGSCVIDPRGQFMIEPVFDKETIIYAEIDPRQAIKENMTLDTSGHYARPDVFSFKVDRNRRNEVK